MSKQKADKISTDFTPLKLQLGDMVQTVQDAVMAIEEVFDTVPKLGDGALAMIKQTRTIKQMLGVSCCC